MAHHKQDCLMPASGTLTQLLPGLIAKVLQDYCAFVQQPVDNDTKAFSQHHMAAKTAVAHLHGLIRLSVLSQAAYPPVIGDAISLEHTLRETRATLLSLKQDDSDAETDEL